MYANLYFDSLAIFKSLSTNEVQNIDSKVGHSNRVMFVEYSLIHFLLRLLQTSTGHIGLANGLNLLEAVLLAQLIKAQVDIIEPLAKFLP